MNEALLLSLKTRGNVLENGQFDVDLVPWSAITSPTTFVRSSDGRCRIVGDGANDGFGVAVALVLNASYRLRFDYQVVSGALNVLKTGMTSIVGLTGTGTYVHDFTEGDGASRTLRWVTEAAGEFFIDNITLVRMS